MTLAVLHSVQKQYPTYCPLAVRYDGKRLYDELSALLPSFESMATIDANIRKRSQWFDIADNPVYEDLERFEPDAAHPDCRVFVPGKVPSWWGVSLTHVPEQPETYWGSSRYRRRYDGRWVWNEAFDVPHTRDLVDRLPLSRVDVVRVLSLPAGGLGPVHVDCQNDAPWEVEGIASISVLLRDGGVAMRFQDESGTLHDVNDPVFYFKDCVPHGVPQVRSRRLLLRINGRADAHRLRAVMDLDRAIW